MCNVRHSNEIRYLIVLSGERDWMPPSPLSGAAPPSPSPICSLVAGTFNKSLIPATFWGFVPADLELISSRFWRFFMHTTNWNGYSIGWCPSPSKAAADRLARGASCAPTVSGCLGQRRIPNYAIAIPHACPCLFLPFWAVLVPFDEHATSDHPLGFRVWIWS